ncbi:MAG TPA: hypothetical protein VN761_06715 [Candidatus Polarisedimenticolia bacterium]|nr:hypothetical protein [Candidatus Polarisedimenticolia bacterium]
MKQIKNIFCMALLAAALAGCASGSSVVVEDPVGPDLAPPRITVNQHQKDGSLVVYSALEAANAVSSDYPTHAGYAIYGKNGKLIRHVENRSGPFDQSPETVLLPPGEYQVKARATNHGLVTVPVVIKENETTVLDLDSSHFRQHKPTGAGQWVRLPSGEVIGMRSP